ncbi:hypothetical protein HHI36_005768 [Cryptolaemus montrouzieri]|uniref:Uncharacterized protein n=1 Tax=Cryptolaemus montrouzieri TaxID=559131 RepID=A0ABD2NV47_9CUCU
MKDVVYPTIFSASLTALFQSGLFSGIFLKPGADAKFRSQKIAFAPTPITRVFRRKLEEIFDSDIFTEVFQRSLAIISRRISRKLKPSARRSESWPTYLSMPS